MSADAGTELGALENVTHDEQVEAVTLSLVMNELLAYKPGGQRDQQRRALYQTCATLQPKLNTLYRTSPRKPRAVAVRELAIGLLYERHGVAHVAEHDPDTHVMLLEMLANPPEQPPAMARSGSSAAGGGTHSTPGGSAGGASSLTFTSPLFRTDAFMLIGTD